MDSLAQRSITLADRHAAIADRTVKLKAQLSELERLRERVGRALLLAKNSSQLNRRKGRKARSLFETRGPGQ